MLVGVNLPVFSSCSRFSPSPSNPSQRSGHSLSSSLLSTGEVFHAGSGDGFTYDEALAHCQEQNASLASTGELYAAWRLGFDKCRAGWLLDHSVRYSINKPRAQCGAGRAGVHTVYAHPNQTAYPALDARYDAYCFRGKQQTDIKLDML